MWQHPNPLETGRLPVHDASMTEKHPKRPRDLNQWAKHMVDLATGEAQETSKAAGQQKGGVAGSAARTAALTPEQRSEIARVAASARWKKG